MLALRPRQEGRKRLPVKAVNALPGKTPQQSGTITTRAGFMKRRDFLKVTGIGAAGAATIGRAGHRAVDAGDQMAPDVELAQSRSTRSTAPPSYMAKLVGEATDNKFQIQTFAAGEIVPGLQVLDAVQNGTVEMGHTASYYYFGKDPTFAFGTARAVRPQRAPSTRPGTCMGGGQRAAERVLQGATTSRRFLAGNTGCQMGGWFRKEIKTVDDLKGLKMRIGGFAGRSCRSSASCRSRSPAATSIRRWKRARSTPPSGSGPTMTRSSASTRSRRTTTIPGWWEGGPMLLGLVNLEKWNSLPKYVSGHHRAGRPGCQHLDDGEIRSGQSGGDEEAARRRHQAARLLAPRSCRRATRPRRSSMPKSPRRTPTSRRCYDSMNDFTSNGYQWWQVAELGYDSFMARQRAELIERSARRQAKTPERCSGVFLFCVLRSAPATASAGPGRNRSAAARSAAPRS